LVTGATGYIGIHCVDQLIKENYIVRGTVRDLNNSLKIDPLKQLEGSKERLELVQADLQSDEGWSQAMTNCTYVLHVASPFPMVTDKSIITIAVNGTLRVLRAAAKSSTVKKVVITSSASSISEGHANASRTFSEADWTNLNSKKTNNYAKSKTLAEKAAWEFVDKEKVKFKLTVINPSFVLGPLLHNVQGTSIQLMRRFLSNEIPAVPAVQFGLVDVRDVAQAHIRAMREARSDGLRILVTSQTSYSFLQIASILRKEFSSQGYTFPKLTVPYPLVWLYSFFNQETEEQVLPRIGDKPCFDNSRKILGMDLRNPEEAIILMAYDIIERGMAPKQKNYRGPSQKIME
uniref:Epimerase domain-containing protein n=1 Tax=Thelazia callipaeda TaxID=103827 RepID=A0A0N5D0L4_THECL